MMLISKGAFVVEMAIPADGLAIFRVGHCHFTCHNLIVLLEKTYNSVLAVIVTPSIYIVVQFRNEHRILVVVGEVVIGSIVDREHRLECQTLYQIVHVVVKTCIELELTADRLCLATEIAVCNGIGLRGFRATGEIFAVEQVQRLAQDGKSLTGIRVNHVNGNQRSCTFRIVRAHR